MKLTPLQETHLIRIVAAPAELERGKGPFEHAGFMNSRSEQALERKGLIRSWTEERPLGGGGAIGQMSMTWRFCEATDDGFLAVKEILDRDKGAG